VAFNIPAVGDHPERRVLAQDALAALCKELYTTASSQVSEKLEDIVLACPYHFDASAYQAAT
jgi:molecular chaperone DnaK (HSP70)